MDVLGPLPVSEKGHKYILVISDYFTKCTEAYPMPNMEAATVAILFVHNFVVLELLISSTLTRDETLNQF